MTERRKFNTLLWKENTFIRPQRVKRNMLTLEEANGRLHKHFPNMNILVYRGANKTALVHCKDCGKTFNTVNNISIYMYGKREECESCKRIKLNIKYSNPLIAYKDLEYKGYTRKANTTLVEYYCNRCKTLNRISASNIVIRKFNGCPKCKEQEIINKYHDQLAIYNCTYIGKYVDGNQTMLKYKCNICDKIDTITVSNLTTRIGNLCKACNTRELFDIYYKSIIKNLEIYGNININMKPYGGGLEFIHLFCGGNRKLAHNYIIRTSSSNHIPILCRNCSNKISSGKPKEHNKHLVQEKLQMLKNVQAFKNAWVKQVPDALEKLNEGFVKTVLRHIDGWINNYEAIVETYPNGDLGTVIENNPLYKQVEEVFYPIMEQYGFKR